MARTILASFFSLLSALGIVRGQKAPVFPYRHLVTGGEYLLQPYTENIIKLTFKPANYSKTENISDAVILKPSLVKAQISREEDSSTTIIIGANKINLNANRIRINKATLLLTEGGAIFNDEYRGFRFSIAEHEKFYGGGSRALPLNRNGHRFNLYNSPWYGYDEGAENLNYSVPFISSSESYGLFFDNASKGYMDLGWSKKGMFEYGAMSGELNFYIILANSQQEILKAYHSLTGTQPLPPKWAMGNLMSRFGYSSEVQVKDIVKQMQEQKFPVDAVIFDLFWFGDSIKNSMGNLDWVNKTNWPNPKKMIADLKSDHINTVLITEPYVLTTAKTYAESKNFQAVDAQGKPYVMTEFYFGNGGLLDLFRKDAQQWFWTKYKQQMDLGVEGWWGDLGEPETHPPAMHHNLSDLGHKRLFNANEVHNLYGHNWTKFLFEKYALEYPNKRLFSLNRSGFAGTQRYSIFPWSGDVSRSWSGLRAQMPVMLGMSMSGVPYMHGDAGGFAGGDGDNELYSRWLQFAVFTPIFRPHGTALYDLDPLAFSYPSEPALFPEPYKSQARKAIELRYRMLPYNYTLTWKQAAEGEPLVAPLYYHFPGDSSAAGIDDQYMWGPALLVAPVVYKAQKERNVYLPSGTWYSFDTGEKFDGGKSYIVQLKEDMIPVFVKEGSFIPFSDAASIRSTGDANSKDISFHYYPSAKTSSYVLFDDDGEPAKAIAQKKYELITLRANPERDGGFSVSVNSNQGFFKGRPMTRNMKLVVHAANNFQLIRINNKDVTASTVYDTKTKTLTIPFNFTSRQINITMY